MEVQRPRSVQHRPLRRTVILGGAAQRIEVYPRGGLCWPRDMGGRAEGAWVLGAQNVETGGIEVFEEGSFIGLDAIWSDGELMDPGLARACGVGWQFYGIREYFTVENEEDWRTMMLAILRAPAMKPCPRLIQVPGCDDAALGRALWAGTATGMLSYNRDGPLHGAIRRYQAACQNGPAPPLCPMLRAAGALVAGLTRWPWRETRRMREEGEW